VKEMIKAYLPNEAAALVDEIDWQDVECAWGA
jgi:hypothetical protein